MGAGVGPGDITRRQQEASETVTLEEVRTWCERDERTIRNQHPPEGRLPAGVEEELAALEPETMTKALRRWAVLKRLFHALERKRRARSEDADARAAVRMLLRREPVRLALGGRDVDVTGRSWAAMYEIASHAMRIRELDADLERIAELHAAAERESRSAGMRFRRRIRLRRRMRRLRALHRRAFREIQRHRRAVYAHALTPSGAPAASIEEVPDWWEELGPAEDAAVLAALFEAGPGRYGRLGEPPKPKRDSERAEDFGWHSLLESIARRERVDPAEPYDRDLFQLLAAERAGASPTLDELGD